MRQPLEEGNINIHRAYGMATFPARFQLILAANPCPCGKGGGKGINCTCTAQQRRRYQSRMSGPLLDRIDIRQDVGHVRHTDAIPAESSVTVRARVTAARVAAKQRLSGTPWSLNGHVPGAWLRTHTKDHAPTTLDLLRRPLDRGDISLRALDRILRLAWTLADLDSADAPAKSHLAMAMTLRLGADHEYA